MKAPRAASGSPTPTGPSPEPPLGDRGGRAGGPDAGSGWHRFHRRKSEVHQRYPTVWSVPLLRKRARLLDGLLRPRARVLDFGAGDRVWEKKVREAAEGVEYRSLDQDPHTRQDYRSLEEVEGSFDLILFIEVIEHLGFEEAVSLLAKLRDLLAPGGRLLLTTPNTAHPTQYWQDPTHRTAWAYDFLGAVLLELGYTDLRCFRLLHARLPAFLAFRGMGWVFHRWAGLDYARTIAVSAGRGDG